MIPSRNIVVIGPILFAYSEFKDFRTDGWQVLHDNSKPTTRVIPNRSVDAWECGRYAFRSLSLTSVLAYMGSLLVSLNSLMRAGNTAVSAAKFTSSALSSKEGNGFGRLVWLAYNPAKHVFDRIAPNLGVVWCGQTRTKQVELTG